MKKLLFVLLGIAAISSCQKVIDVDLNDSDPILVIEAVYTTEDSTVRVQVTKTSNYFDNSNAPSIDNALITIIDQSGSVQTIPSVGNGKYELTNYAPTFDSNYTIAVTHDGVVYTSTTVLHSVIPQLPIFYVYEQSGFFGGPGGYLAFLNYNDPVAEGDHIYAKYWRNDTLVDDFQTDDALTNGNLVQIPLFATFFDIGDTVDVEMRTIDEKVYDYFEELDGASDPSSAAPANPTYQWTNNALGYFTAYGVSRQEVVIQ